MVFGPDDNLYVTSFGTHEVLRYDGQTGAFIDAFATCTEPTGLTFVPEPATLLLLGFGALALLRKRTRQSLSK